MTWKELQRRGHLAEHKTSGAELTTYCRMVERDLEDAAVPGLSTDRSFAIAYSAVYLLAKMVIACAGYRIKGEGGHRTTFRALELSMGKDVKDLASYFEICRRKRNQLTYDTTGNVGGAEARELLTKARWFQKMVREWIEDHHPDHA